VSAGSAETKKDPYSFECFRDVAMRRGHEAKQLLDGSKKRCDGAVTCALLATECAMKATLIFGNEVKYHHELPADIQAKAFKGSSGHDLMQLFALQPAAVTAKLDADGKVRQAVRRLHGRPRYEHRYGYKRPPVHEARLVVTDAQTIITWMKEIVR